MEKKLDLRILKTHKALCDTFMTLICEKKFEDITVNELCDRALVRRATFYKHFADKYDFFAFFVRKIQEDLTLKVTHSKTNCDLDPTTYFLSLFVESVKYLGENRTLVKNIVTSTTFSSLLDILSDEIYRNVVIHLKVTEEKGITMPAPISLLSSFYTGGIIYTLRHWVTAQEQVPEEKLIESFGEILKAFHI